MEREIKDVAGTPNWMAPEVIELKSASSKSDIWSLGCTVIELLTGRPPYGDIGNAMTVMFRIVEDESPPIPEHSFSPLVSRSASARTHRDRARKLFKHEVVTISVGAERLNSRIFQRTCSHRIGYLSFGG
ncbi:kinase-like domain-containing protein [Lactarius pseudohatsudake]|nr:kinase-like domain-containing protein [Lactarius pseudohatsudake]